MKGTGHWGIGIAVAFVGHPLLGLATWLATLAFPRQYWISEFAVFELLAPGLTQFVWVIPAAVAFWLVGHKRTVWGLLLTASVLCLLNAACFGVIFGGLAMSEFGH